MGFHRFLGRAGRGKQGPGMDGGRPGFQKMTPLSPIIWPCRQILRPHCKCQTTAQKIEERSRNGQKYGPEKRTARRSYFWRAMTRSAQLLVFWNKPFGVSSRPSGAVCYLTHALRKKFDHCHEARTSEGETEPAKASKTSAKTAPTLRPRGRKKTVPELKNGTGKRSQFWDRLAVPKMGPPGATPLVFIKHAAPTVPFLGPPGGPKTGTVFCAQ